ncbi:Uncharacterized protein APZ42_011626 [Daphnia magna]|uniref:Uncharacterized protein n=1 Tax=Daphnia magna TaxID=35525 RepID=A0A162SVA5_9CRUS|nr:Uncharacterized protein APZ42_011626 [Daphnia magna]
MTHVKQTTDERRYRESREKEREPVCVCVLKAKGFIYIEALRCMRISIRWKREEITSKAFCKKKEK